MEGTMYSNNRPGKDNGRIASVIKYDDRAKTVILQYIDDEKKVGPISLSTLKRWWKKTQACETVTSSDVVESLIDLDNPITDQEAEEHGMLSGDEAVEQAVVSTDDSYCSDGTSYSEVMKEIVADEQSLVKHRTKKSKKSKKASKKSSAEKVDRKAHKKREFNAHIDEILDYIYECVEELGGNIGVPRDVEMKFRALRKENGKQFCKLVWSGKSVKLVSKTKLDQYGCYAVNYPLPNVYEFVNCDEKAIKDVLTISFNECAEYKTKKTKKKED